MDLTQGMTVAVGGDVTIDGSRAFDPCGHHDTTASFHTPPIIRVKQTRVSIAGTFSLVGAGSVSVASAFSMSLGGDFNNQCVRPECFDWQNGELLLDGTSPQFFEVAARDVGAVASLEDAEFSIEAVTVAAASNVTFRDAFDNDHAGQAACSEALYVGTLALGVNSNITLDNCRIYSERIIIDPSVPSCIRPRTRT